MVSPHSVGLPPKHGKTPAGVSMYGLNPNKMTALPAGSTMSRLQRGSSSSSNGRPPHCESLPSAMTRPPSMPNVSHNSYICTGGGSGTGVGFGLGGAAGYNTIFDFLAASAASGSSSTVGSTSSRTTTNNIGGDPRKVRLAPPGYSIFDSIRNNRSNGINDENPTNPHPATNKIRLGSVPLPKVSRPAAAPGESAIVPYDHSRPAVLVPAVQADSRPAAAPGESAFVQYDSRPPVLVPAVQDSGPAAVVPASRRQGELNGFSNRPTKPSQVRPVDPNWDSKKTRRVIANRLSAQKSRTKKLTYVAELQIEAGELEATVDQLTTKKRQEELYNHNLRLENLRVQHRIAVLATERLSKDAENAALKVERDRLLQIYNLQQQQTAAPIMPKYEELELELELEQQQQQQPPLVLEQQQQQQPPLVLEQQQPQEEAGWHVPAPMELDQRSREKELLDIFDSLNPPNNLDPINLDSSNKTPNTNIKMMNNREQMSGDLDNMINSIGDIPSEHMANNMDGISDDDLDSLINSFGEVPSDEHLTNSMNGLKTDDVDASEELLDAVIRHYT